MLRLELLVNVVTLAYLLLFAWQTTLGAIERSISNEMWETAAGFLEVWPSRWLLPAGLVVMALFVLFRILQDLRGALQSDDSCCEMA